MKNIGIPEGCLNSNHVRSMLSENVLQLILNEIYDFSHNIQSFMLIIMIPQPKSCIKNITVCFTIRKTLLYYDVIL